MIEYSNRKKKATLGRNVLCWIIVLDGTLFNIVEEAGKQGHEASLAITKQADHIFSAQKKVERMLPGNRARP